MFSDSDSDNGDRHGQQEDRIIHTCTQQAYCSCLKNIIKSMSLITIFTNVNVQRFPNKAFKIIIKLHIHRDFQAVCCPTERVQSYRWYSSSDSFVGVRGELRDAFECKSYHTPAVYLLGQQPLKKNAVIAKKEEENVHK